MKFTHVTKQKETNIDITSILLSIVAFGGLLYGFNQLQESGFNNLFTIISLTAGLIALVLFIWRQLRLPTPILELRVFKVRSEERRVGKECRVRWARDHYNSKRG